MSYRDIDEEHCHAVRERLRQRQGGGLGKLEPIYGSTKSSDGRSWRMMGDNNARGARHGDKYPFLQPFGHCKREATMLCGQVCYKSDGGPRIGKGVGWRWAVRRWGIFEVLYIIAQRKNMYC